MTKRVKSFVFGGLVGLAILIFGIVRCSNASDFSSIWLWIVLGITSYTLTSCLILSNNFILDMIVEILSWGFVKMPGLIFTLDLDGIIWLLTVKLIFWIIELTLACICAVLAIGLALIASVFVYPYALLKNIKHGEIG